MSDDEHRNQEELKLQLLVVIFSRSWLRCCIVYVEHKLWYTLSNVGKLKRREMTDEGIRMTCLYRKWSSGPAEAPML